MTIEEFLKQVPLQMKLQPVSDRPDRGPDAFHYLYTLSNLARANKWMTGFYSMGLAHRVLIRMPASIGSGSQPNNLLRRNGQSRSSVLPEPARLKAGEADLFRRVTKLSQLDEVCRMLSFAYEPVLPTLFDVVGALRLDMGMFIEYDNMWDFIEGHGFDSAREGGRVWEALRSEQDQLKELLGPTGYHTFVYETEEWE